MCSKCIRYVCNLTSFFHTLLQSFEVTFSSSCTRPHFQCICVNQCRAVAHDADTQTHRQTGLVLLCSAEAQPRDCWLMQNRNTGVEQLEGEREWEWVKAEARLMAKEKERDGAPERRVGGKRERGRNIIEPVWVSRLTELQGAAPAHHCYCQGPALCWMHPEVPLIVPGIMSVCFLSDVK